MKVRTIVAYARKIFSKIPTDINVKILHRYFLKEAQHIPKASSGPIVAIQGVELPLYYAIFGQIMLDLRRRTNISGRLILIRSLTVGNSLYALVERSQIVSYLITSQWARINKQVVGPVGYRSQGFGYLIGDIVDIFRSYSIWRSLFVSSDISKLCVSEIPVGDLVIDSYLRFKPSPEFQIKDRFVWLILWQTHRDIRRANLFFKEYRPALYLSSYSTYIQHGIAVRVALREGVDVYVFGSSDVFCKKLTFDDLYHATWTKVRNYRSIFESYPQQSEKLIEAETQILKRLSGKIDHATRYMRVSAYAKNNEKIPSMKDSVIVFLHDFCDSPHIYDGMIFNDFWEWIVFTIETLTHSGVRFFLKPHPNQIPESEDAVALLRARYPKVNFISSRITTTQLVDAGMICGITVYGTVAHELAYLGVPLISCADHPHHSFEFSRTARSIEQYQIFLQNPNYQPLSKEEMRRQALAFYYMHNIDNHKNPLVLIEQLTKLWSASDESGESLIEEIINLQKMPEYHNFVINPLVDAIETSCKRNYAV